MDININFLNERPLSYSSIKEFAKSPSHYIQYLRKDREPTKEMNFGSLMHCMLLYQDLFDDLFIVAPDVDRRTKDGKAEWEEFQSKTNNKIIITSDELDDAHSISSKAFLNKEIKDAIGGCNHSEKPWSKVFEGLPFRGFFDSASDTYIVELKTTSDASPSAFISDFIKRKYYLQASIYQKASGLPIKYVVVETKPPYNNFVATIEQDLLDYGARELDKLISKFNECMILNAWEMGYEFMNDGPIIINKPTWMK